MNRLIYKPGGAAGEYAELALNMYHGCEHGCVYCYVPSCTRTNRTVFHNSIYPKKDFILRLKKDVSTFKGIKKPVLLSFTCDPYQTIEESYELTRKSIELLNEYGFPVKILTKAGKLARRDFDILSLFPDNEFGVSLTLLDLRQSRKWEPLAATPKQRIKNLELAHKSGIFTWASLEPIIDVEQTLKLIDLTHSFTNFYGVGKINYNKHQSKIDWKTALQRIEKRLKKYKKKKLIHETLKRENSFKLKKSK